VLDNFKFTLYEFFGYLLPGTTLLGALLIIAWAIYHPGKNIALDLKVPIFVSGAGILISYLLGHATQAIGNLIFRDYARQLAEPKQTLIPAQILLCVKNKIATIVMCSSPELSPEWIVRFCDEAVVQGGKDGDREVFVYREGFYKGSAVAVTALAVATALRAVIPGGSVSLQSRLAPLRTADLATASLVLAAIAYLLGRRVRRFAEYRITRTLTAFVLLKPEIENQKTTITEALHD